MIIWIHDDSITLLYFNKISLKFRHLFKRLVDTDRSKLIKVVQDPIVSSDVIGMKESIIYDSMGSLKIGNNMIKTLTWYDNGYNHASRILDVISCYEGLK